MNQASTWGDMSPELRKVAERARREPDGRFHSLAHLLHKLALARAVGRLRANAAVGVDRVTKEMYERDLWGNLEGLVERLKAKRYRHQPIRRVHIPKDNGKTRPLGISAFEDKVVQDAIREVLQAVYEQDFLDCSHGFRPGRRAHDAIRALHRSADQGVCNWILEADITSFFDSVDRAALLEMLRKRLADGSLLRLIGKCLNVGVLDGEEFSTPDMGTAQGSVLSPLLGNIYLHYVLDEWFERVVRPRLRGRATLVRYADDFVIAFELRSDADRVWDVLPKRMQRFGLALHPDKTRLLDFRRPPAGPVGGERSEQLRFPRVHAVLAANALGSLAAGVSDTACATSPRDERGVRMVPGPPASTGGRSARGAQESAARPHQLLRGKWQLAKCGLPVPTRPGAWKKWLSRRSQRAWLTWERMKRCCSDIRCLLLGSWCRSGDDP